MTGEGYKDGDLSPREQLTQLLCRDFTPIHDAEVLADPNAGGLAVFLAMARDPDSVEERLASQECHEYATAVGDALDEAVVTDEFKKYIVGHVVQAYAFEKPVDDAVSPSSLGIVSGEGIFGDETAQDIEAACLRGYLFDIINKHFMMPDEPGGRLLVVNTVAYLAALSEFSDWRQAFVGKYENDAFAGLELAAFMAAAPVVQTMSPEETRQSGFGDIIAELNRFRRPPESEA